MLEYYWIECIKMLGEKIKLNKIATAVQINFNAESKNDFLSKNQEIYTFLLSECKGSLKQATEIPSGFPAFQGNINPNIMSINLSALSLWAQLNHTMDLDENLKLIFTIIEGLKNIIGDIKVDRIGLVMTYEVSEAEYSNLIKDTKIKIIPTQFQFASKDKIEDDLDFKFTLQKYNNKDIISWDLFTNKNISLSENSVYFNKIKKAIQGNWEINTFLSSL